ncbi:MAG: hypothetical protein AAF805_05930 [Planctomycetota bacterium]
MNRHTIVAAAATAALVPAIAWGDARELRDQGDWDRVIQLEVSPADEPEFPYQHRFTYSPHELLPGNSINWYLRAYPEESMFWRAWNKATGEEEFDKFYGFGTPISELPQEELANHGRRFGHVFKDYIIPAAKRRETDWGIRYEQVRGEETVSFLLPEFQGMRSFARLGSLGVRHAIAEGRYADAIEHLRTMYRLGRDCGAEPLIVCGLIGVAITQMAGSGVTDLIAAPDAPNLYWALTELPAIPVRFEEAVRLELELGPRMFEALDDPDNAERTAAEWNAVWRRVGALSDILDGLGGLQRTPEPWEAIGAELLPTAAGLTGYSHAKRRLVEWGFDADEIEAMAVGQVLSIYSARVYKIATDAFQKGWSLPYPEGRRVMYEAEGALRSMAPLSNSDNRELLPIATMIVPAIQATQTAQYRCARQLAVLRVIEALRMHAARNDGRLPRSLAEVACVPIPDNPMTGAPFTYHRSGRQGVIDLPAWEGWVTATRYEITSRLS